jgi:hypothetical protein
LGAFLGRGAQGRKQGGGGQHMKQTLAGLVEGDGTGFKKHRLTTELIELPA